MVEVEALRRLGVGEEEELLPLLLLLGAPLVAEVVAVVVVPVQMAVRRRLEVA